MAETIYIGDSIVDAETKVLFGDQDFVDLVYEKMGRDAAETQPNATFIRKSVPRRQSQP